jgi:DNA polymerase V
MKAKPYYKSATLELYSVSTDSALQLPLVEGGISAGFPSPASDFMDASIDLNTHLIRNPSATFIAVVNGFSMQGAGIYHKDMLIIDKSIEPADGKIAVCVINGEFTLKRLRVTNEGIFLMPENETYSPVKITEFHDFEIWGIVTYSIKSH